MSSPYQHTAYGQQLTDELDQATAATVQAQLDHEQAEVSLTDLEADLDRLTPTRLVTATAKVEIASRRMASAVRRQRAAERQLTAFNPYSDLAEALLPMARFLTPEPGSISAAPTPLADVPDLTESGSAVAVVQQHAAVSRPGGALASGEHPHLRDTPIVLTHFYRQGQPEWTAERILAAALATGVQLDNRANDLRPRTRHHANGVVQEDYSLQVSQVYPARPTVSGEPELDLLLRKFTGSVQASFTRLGDRTPSCGVITTAVSSSRRDGARSLRVQITFGWDSRVGTHSEQLDQVTRVVNSWTGKPVATLGRCTGAKLTDPGRSHRTGPHWGQDEAVAELIFVAASGD